MINPPPTLSDYTPLQLFTKPLHLVDRLFSFSTDTDPLNNRAPPVVFFTPAAKDVISVRISAILQGTKGLTFNASPGGGTLFGQFIHT